MARKWIIRQAANDAFLTPYGFKPGGAARDMALRFDTEVDARGYVDTQLPMTMRGTPCSVEQYLEPDDRAPVGHQASTDYDPYGFGTRSRE